MNHGHDQVLESHAKAVAHMWRQLHSHRLGLILGAGVSRPFNFPTWPELVKRVSASPELNAGTAFTHADELPLPILTEVLFQRFREGHRAKYEAITKSIGDVDRLLLAEWRRIIHRCLYDGTPDTTEELWSIDSAYRHFLRTIRDSVLTVTYNFDDVLERMLLHSRTESERQSTQTFQSVVDARLPFRAGQTVILHPNGYLPHSLMEASSDTLVFSEGTFADQLIDVMAGQFSTLLHYLTKHTFLLLGLSLEDETLRHLLRQSARISPGNFHYYVRYVSDPAKLSTDAKHAEIVSNFETYNLITLHLDGAGVNALGDLLSMERAELVARSEEIGVPLNYTYYLAGVPGVGKTTTFGYFNTLVTHDEWLEPRLPLMSVPFTDLTAEQVEQVDNWIFQQIGLKNRRMLDDASTVGIGIHVVDRCPPDAITFTKPEGWARKAEQVREAISPGFSRRRIHPGHVFLLEADPEEITVRAALREKTSTPDYTRNRMRDLRALYMGEGTTILGVDRMTPAEVVRAVASRIFFEEFVSADLHGRVDEVVAGTRVSPHISGNGAVAGSPRAGTFDTDDTSVV